MKLERADTPGEEWDEFVLRQTDAQLGHAAAWPEVLRRAYGASPESIVARSDAGELLGVLPLVGFRGLSGRRSLISLPMLDAAGPLAVDEVVRRALLDAAVDRARSLGGVPLEIREIAPDAGDDTEGADFDRVDLFMPLATDEEAQWKAIGAKTRNQTRKATKEGLALLDPEGRRPLDDFYGPFQENMRDLGSPVHARRFFEAVLALFGEGARLINVGLDGRSVGGLLAIHFGRSVTVPWASTLRAERRRCPNNAIYWESLRWAIERGATEFDFGRSPRGGGTHRFKLGWGAQERRLLWQGASRADYAWVPIASAASGAAMQRVSDLWTRLPLGITNRLGPQLRARIAN